MIGLLAAALILPALPLIAPTIGINDPRVAKVSCITGSGTAFRVAKDYWLTVSHVTNAGGCTVDGEPIKDLWRHPSKDFSIFFLSPRKGRALAIDCGGFVRGRQYVAIGHARGLKEQTTITVVATGETREGFGVLRGVFTVVPGQSGGVLIDKETRKAVGAINVYEPRQGWSGGIALRDTPVCAHA